jgi:hypothetical protein
MTGGGVEENNRNDAQGSVKQAIRFGATAVSKPPERYIAYKIKY